MIIKPTSKNRDSLPIDNSHEMIDQSTIDNYVLAEFVAIPPDFDIQSHLSMREHIGLFELKDINLKQLSIISDGVANSALFSSMNNPNINSNTCLFFLQLISELNLIIKNIYNPLRRSNIEYKQLSKRYENDKSGYIQEQHAISFLIINIVPLLNNKIIDESWDAMNDIYKFQIEVNKNEFKID